MTADQKTLNMVLYQAKRLLPIYEGHKAPHWKLLPDGTITANFFIETPEQLGQALQRDVSCFGFFPPDAHIIVIDIDRGHNDHIDGLAIFKERFPAVFAEIKNMPYCSTPHNGLHLFLGYDGPHLYKSGHIAPGIEIHYTGFLDTAPGSLNVDNGRLYLMYRDFRGFPDITSKPFSDLLPYLHERTVSTSGKSNGKKSVQLCDSRNYGKRAQFIVRTICRKFTYEGRQNKIFRAAQWAYREGIPYKIMLHAVMTVPDFNLFSSEDPESFQHAMTKRG